MSDQMVIVMAIKLLFGFMSAFISVLLWSKTRDGAWLAVVMGVVFLYIQTLLEILDTFGFVFYRTYKLGEIELIPLAFDIIPFIFFGIGMLLFLFRIRKF